MQTYDHNQASGSSSWVINHDFDTDSVAIDVFVDNGGDLEKILPADVVASSDNTLTITFSSAQTGWARVIGL